MDILFNKTNLFLNYGFILKHTSKYPIQKSSLSSYYVQYYRMNAVKNIQTHRQILS